MSSMASRRIQKELAEYRKDTTEFTLEPVGDSLSHLVAVLPGPGGTAWGGGKYELDIVVPDNYPYSPPKLKFITKVYHPNVNRASGAICLGMLEREWSPLVNIQELMSQLRSRFYFPDPNDLGDDEVMKHFLTNQASFRQTAKQWAQAYAGAPADLTTDNLVESSDAANDNKAVQDENAGLDEIYIAQFEDIGFERQKVMDVLERLDVKGPNVGMVSEDRIVEELLK